MELREQIRYSPINRFKYCLILVNNVIFDNGTDDEEYKSVHEILLDGMIKISQIIFKLIQLMLTTITYFVIVLSSLPINHILFNKVQ